MFGCSTKWADKRQTAASAVKKWDSEPVTLETIDLDGIKKLAKNEAEIESTGDAAKPDQSKLVQPSAIKSSKTGPGQASDEKTASPGKLTLVNLWATWCGPCVQELPELVTINRMYRQRAFHFVTISLDEPDAKDAGAESAGGRARIWERITIFSGTDKDKLAEALDRRVAWTVAIHTADCAGGRSGLSPCRPDRTIGIETGDCRLFRVGRMRGELNELRAA